MTSANLPTEFDRYAPVIVVEPHEDAAGKCNVYRIVGQAGSLITRGAVYGDSAKQAAIDVKWTARTLVADGAATIRMIVPEDLRSQFVREFRDEFASCEVVVEVADELPTADEILENRKVVRETLIREEKVLRESITTAEIRLARLVSSANRTGADVIAVSDGTEIGNRVKAIDALKDRQVELLDQIAELR